MHADSIKRQSPANNSLSKKISYEISGVSPKSAVSHVVNIKRTARPRNRATAARSPYTASRKDDCYCATDRGA